MFDDSDPDKIVIKRAMYYLLHTMLIIIIIHLL